MNKILTYWKETIHSKSFKLSLIVYACFLLLYIGGAWLSDSLLAKGFNIRPMGWGFLPFWSMGVILLILQKPTGFPQFVDLTISTKWRYFTPLITGILFALPDVIIRAVLKDQLSYTSLPPFTQPFPYSIFLYFTGAIWVDIIFKLLPLTVIMLVAKYWFSVRTATIIFWVFAIILSLYEPIEQLNTDNSLLAAYDLTTGIAFNLLAIWYFKKAGWLAALLVRIGHYSIWHILLGVYIEYVVLN